MSHLKPAAHQNKSSSSPLSRLVQKLRRTSPEPPIPIFAPAKPDVPSDIPCAPPRELAPVSALSSARVVEEQEAPPPVAQAVVHLALLEVFWRYKQRFLDPSAEVKTFFGSALGWPEDEAWEQQDAQVVWEVVVEIAVGRFEAWWKIVGREVEKLKWEDRPGNDGPGNWTPDDGIIRNVTELPLEMLPPLGYCLVLIS